MPLKVECGMCGKVFSVPDHYAGRAGQCTGCHAPIQAPLTPTETVDPLGVSSDQLATFRFPLSGTPLGGTPLPGRTPSGRMQLPTSSRLVLSSSMEAASLASITTTPPPAPNPLEPPTVLATPPPVAPSLPDFMPPAPAPTREVTVGRTVGGYTLLRKLGDVRSTVFLAETPSGQKIALKILPQVIGQRSPNTVKRFLREARSLLGLEHPHVVTVFDVGDELGTLWLAMELFEGKTVRELLSELGGRLPEPVAIGLTIQAARGLGHLSRQKLVHRSVKPEHILVGPGAAVKLVGLGLVKTAEEGDDVLTGKWTVVGTPQYMSPEQGRATRELDVRSDLFALGVTLYEMLAGEVPWTDKSPINTLRKVETEPLPDVRQKAPTVRPVITLVLEKLVAKDPEKRYQSAEQLVSDLTAIEDGALVDGKPPSFAPRPAPIAPVLPPAPPAGPNDVDTLKGIQVMPVPLVTGLSPTPLGVSSSSGIGAAPPVRDSFTKLLLFLVAALMVLVVILTIGLVQCHFGHLPN